jgi:hypothetical protein
MPSTRALVASASILCVALLTTSAKLAAETLDSSDRSLPRDAAHGAKTLVLDTTYVLISPLRMDAHDAFVLGGILSATGLLMVFDADIRDAFNRNAETFPLEPLVEVGRFLDPVAYGRMNVYYLGGLGISYAAGWDTGTSVFGEILTSFAVYGLLKKPVELLVGRQRPYQEQGAYSFWQSDATSFFSGHTVNTFQVATVVSHHVDRRWFTGAAYLAATCVGLQRVEADAHWASDVFLSAAFAIAVSRSVIALHENRRVEPLVQPGPQGLAVGLTWRF